MDMLSQSCMPGCLAPGCFTWKPGLMGHRASAGRVLYPVALAVHSEHLAMELLGWRTAAGMRLHRPLLLSMQFTPALAQCALPPRCAQLQSFRVICLLAPVGLKLLHAGPGKTMHGSAVRSYLFVRLSPVLGAAVEMEGGGTVEVRLTPAGLALPAEATAVRLEPMHLALASRGPVQNLIRRGSFLLCLQLYD